MEVKPYQRLTIGANHVANNDFLTEISPNSSFLMTLQVLKHKEKSRATLPTNSALFLIWQFSSLQLGSPLASGDTPAFITDTPFGSGKAIDLVDGHVEIPTGEAEDIFDGGSGFSVSAWVKGAANDLQAVISKGSIMDLSVKQGLKAWYDASSATNFSTSTTADTTPANNGHAHRWKDLSGMDMMRLL